MDKSDKGAGAGISDFASQSDFLLSGRADFFKSRADFHKSGPPNSVAPTAQGVPQFYVLFLKPAALSRRVDNLGCDMRNARATNTKSNFAPRFLRTSRGGPCHAEENVFFAATYHQRYVGRLIPHTREAERGARVHGCGYADSKGGMQKTQLLTGGGPADCGMGSLPLFGGNGLHHLWPVNPTGLPRVTYGNEPW